MSFHQDPTAEPTITKEDEARFAETAHYSKRKSKAVETTFRLRIVSGRGNQALAEDICKAMRHPLTPVRCASFANGECNIKIEQNVRGDDVFIIQPVCTSDQIDINSAQVELLLLVHTLRLASVKRVTAIVPYFAYARQDRKTKPRVPISASCVAQMLMAMGVDRVVTVDLHCGQIQGFFHNTPVDNLPMAAEWAHTVVKRIGAKEGVQDPSEELCIVSPDAGGVERAIAVADRVQAKAVVTILKRRVEANKVDKMEMVGDVKGLVCVIIDDICDTGGTLCKACNLLMENGARAVYACITHGILTDPCNQRITDCEALKELITTDSMPKAKEILENPKIRIVSLAPLLAEAIERTHIEQSLSHIFRQPSSLGL